MFNKSEYLIDPYEIGNIENNNIIKSYCFLIDMNRFDIDDFVVKHILSQLITDTYFFPSNMFHMCNDLFTTVLKFIKSTQNHSFNNEYYINALKKINKNIFIMNFFPSGVFQYTTPEMRNIGIIEILIKKIDGFGHAFAEYLTTEILKDKNDFIRFICAIVLLRKCNETHINENNICTLVYVLKCYALMGYKIQQNFTVKNNIIFNNDTLMDFLIASNDTTQATTQNLYYNITNYDFDGIPIKINMQKFKNEILRTAKVINLKYKKYCKIIQGKNYQLP